MSHTYTPEVEAALAERCSSVAVDAAFADRMVRQRDAALAQLEAEVEQLRHINDACIELENQLRHALERAAKAAAILNESHA